MGTQELLNLYVGGVDPGIYFRYQGLSRIEVRLKTEYASLQANLAQQTSVNYGWQAGSASPLLRKAGKVAPKVKGDWVATAEVTWPDDGCVECSILSRIPMEDAGVWDVCQLLTLLTGRQVTIPALRERHDPRPVADPAGLYECSLYLLGRCWDERWKLVDGGVHYALLLYNAGIESLTFHGKASAFSAALNILVDQLGVLSNKVDRKTRALVSVAVKTAVDGISELTAIQKEAYKALLGSKAMEGTGSFHERTIEFLKKTAILEENASPDAETRVRYVNAIRNRAVHSGQMPTLGKLGEDASDRCAMNIVAAVLPAIVRAALLQVLGLGSADSAYAVDDVPALKGFFENGAWQGWKPEEEDIVEWLEQDGLLEDGLPV